jgi:hypothetical protein
LVRYEDWYERREVEEEEKRVKLGKRNMRWKRGAQKKTLEGGRR